MIRTQPMKFLTFAVLLAALVGCATGPKAPRMTLNIDGGMDINPNLEGRPSPVVLYIYSLGNSTIFNNARFIELYTNARDVLGVDFLGVEEVEVSPGETLHLVQRELPEETRHLGVLAAFRDVDNATWRGLVNIEEGEKFDLNITIQKKVVSVSKD